MSWTVRSVMTEKVVAVRPQMPYKEMVALMSERGVSALPVVDVTDSDGRVVGIVSDADLLIKEERPPHRPGGALVRPGGAEARAKARDAEALMTAPVLTVRPEATLTEAARTMHRSGFKRLPVVDEHGRLVGIVSRSDLLKPFLRSDESIHREVVEDVMRDTLAIEGAAADVRVDEGVVTLDGELETRGLAALLVRLVGRIEGVVAVDDRLRWRLDESHLRPDVSPLALRFSASERP